VLKNRVALKFFTVLKYFLLFRNFEQLALVLKTEFDLKFFTGLKYFLSFRNFEQLALPLETEFALKLFNLEGGSLPPPASYAYDPMVKRMKTLYSRICLIRHLKAIRKK